MHHIQALLDQSTDGKVANFGEPCAKCEHIAECRADWLTKISAVINRSSVGIELNQNQRRQQGKPIIQLQFWGHFCKWSIALYQGIHGSNKISVFCNFVRASEPLEHIDIQFVWIVYQRNKGICRYKFLPCLKFPFLMYSALAGTCKYNIRREAGNDKKHAFVAIH